MMYPLADQALSGVRALHRSAATGGRRSL